MATNYNKAHLIIYHGLEELFAPTFATFLQPKAWDDLVLLQSHFIMDPMNSGIAHLARISHTAMGFSVPIRAIIVLDDKVPQGLLEAVDSMPSLASNEEFS